MRESNALEAQNVKRRNVGFTLAELLVVVAIVGVLVAISIPVFSAQLHKARVAADWANLRSYYSEIQADYISTGKYNPKVPLVEETYKFDETEIDFLDGQKVKMKDGFFAVTKASTGKGYQIAYYCNKTKTDWEKHSRTCVKIFGASE